MKIYTKTGDKGTTALFGGKRVNKDDIRIEAYGTVDELNANIGLLIGKLNESESTLLKQVQAVLFDLGSHLASDGTADKFLPQLSEDIVTVLEKTIDKLTASLPKLKSFILPGGNSRIAQAHICRTVCRRAERRVVSLSEIAEVEQLIVKYLNRLSDYFFVFARHLALEDGIDEVKWNPK